jgi:hypothetical protein
MAYHQEDLAKLGGENVGEDESLRLEPRCHPGNPVVVVYDLSHHLVVIACATCKMGVADIAVARRPSTARAMVNVPVQPTTVQRMDASARRNRARKKK